MASAFQLAAPLVLRDAIDSLRSVDADLLRYPVVFGGLAIGQAAFKFASRQLFLGRARRVEHDLRATYFARLVRLPTDRVERERKGDLVSRATHDLQDVRLFLGAGVLNFSQTLLLLGAATVLLWRIHAPLTVAALLPFPIISVLVRKYSPRLHRRFTEANRRAGELSAFVHEGLAGIRVVRSYGREAWQAERFETANRDLRDAENRVVWAWAVLFPAVGAVGGLGHVVVLGLGGVWVARGVLTLGDFVAFHAYLAMLVWPMVALGWTLSLVQRGAAALDRLGEVLRSPEEPTGARSVAAPGPCLEARSVGFRHEGALESALEEVNLSLPEGGYWGLVGSTASGKSTLVSLLARLRHPTRGEIRVHDAPLEEVDGGALRRHLAVVPQGGYLFPATLAANVCLGRSRDDDAVWWCLGVAGLASEVQAMPERLETTVGEGGITLSGGQRQRLAIARALYGRPRTVILDSALSNLDTHTARHVLEGIRHARPDLTLLVVSHRGSEVDGADGVWFLDEGRIVAQGKHRDLLRSTPKYLRLYREEELRRELREVLA